MGEFVEILANFAINFAIVFVIVRLIYYPQQRDKHYVFTFFVFNTIVFFVMGLLNNSDISVGVGFGLFAIFSILRYRTDTIPIREMTYLFVLIALPVLNSILLGGEGYAEFAVANLATIGVLFVLEKGWGFEYEIRKTITYERIDMIRPENWPQLKADLEERTGLPIKRIEIGRLNFLRDTAQINVYYDARALESQHVRFATSEGAFAGDAGYDD
ncbi:DUF4956 domain-containing protein [Aggregatilinea lenta]|uniref:DUF4956 domain-containing protein n=1 Tax=Aggregatilinea lenta TaxID=913108 RepID=UPI000E5B9CBF|nr:DUF4956 domain-containing protein [Aggregatilinea lenta]